MFLKKRFSKESQDINILEAKDKTHLPYLKEFEKYRDTFVASEDGSIGIKGNFFELSNSIRKYKFNRGDYFFNCDSKNMIEAILPLEKQVTY